MVLLLSYETFKNDGGLDFIYQKAKHINTKHFEKGFITSLSKKKDKYYLKTLHQPQ